MTNVVESDDIRIIVENARANGVLFCFAERDTEDALLFLKLSFPHYCVTLFDRGEKKVILTYPATVTKSESAIQTMREEDYSIKTINWHLTANLISTICSSHRRISMTCDPKYSKNAFDHISKFHWQGISLRGSLIAAYFEREDRFDMSGFDEDHIFYAGFRDKKKENTLPDDIVNFKFDNWTIESADKSFLSRLKSYFIK